MKGGLFSLIFFQLTAIKNGWTLISVTPFIPNLSSMLKILTLTAN